MSPPAPGPDVRTGPAAGRRQRSAKEAQGDGHQDDAGGEGAQVRAVLQGERVNDHESGNSMKNGNPTANP